MGSAVYRTAAAITPYGERRAGLRSLPPTVQWVVKISKFCNLRCRYCYEYPELGDARRMSLAQLERTFRRIAECFGGSGRRMEFVWHGGEPLLIEPDYYRRIFRIQQAVLGAAGVAFGNSIQTNLTHLGAAQLALLREAFSYVGVSLDIVGSQRVNARGLEQQDRVLANLDRLLAAGVRAGCITVLSQTTLPHLDAIYRFFEDTGLSFRLLPIYRTGYAGQQAPHALSAEQIRDAFIRVVDLWFASDAAIQVRPVQDYIVNAIRLLNIDGIDLHRYDKTEAEIVYIVDTDGSLYSNADAYDPALRHGNIFADDFAAMRCSDGYRRAVAAAQARMTATCQVCPLHGACSGYFMGEATPEQRFVEDGRLACLVARPVQEYALRRLQEPAVLQSLRAQARILSEATAAPDLPA